MTQQHLSGALYMLGFIAWLFVAYNGFSQADWWWGFAILCPFFGALLDVFVD